MAENEFPTEGVALTLLLVVSDMERSRFISLMMNVAMTEIRSSSKAAPGPPSGNIENRRCTT